MAFITLYAILRNTYFFKNTRLIRAVTPKQRAQARRWCIDNCSVRNQFNTELTTRDPEYITYARPKLGQYGVLCKKVSQRCRACCRATPITNAMTQLLLARGLMGLTQ